MFQSFAVTARPDQGPPRLAAVRAEMLAAGLAGFIVPRADAFQGEYVAPRDERLSWLTGFTGSAGFCVVLQDIAGVFIDGRYRTQVKSQVDLTAFTPVAWPDTTLADWVKENLDTRTIGFDPWLHTAGQIDALAKAFAETDITLKACDNLVDAAWADQPNAAEAPARIHPLSFAGESHDEKRKRLADQLKASKSNATVITLPDNLCWLLNIRGSDIPRNPIVQGHAVLHADAHVDLYLAPEKVTDIADHLGPEVRVHPSERLLPDLKAMSGPILIEKASTPYIIAETLGDRAAFGTDLCALPKARKNASEIEGSAAAHLRDGAAMVELLAWLDAQAPGTITETQVVSKLEALRARDNALQDISFETISGTGPNGAIIHYRVTEDTDSTLEDGQLLVLDSGGQYLDGTTDITRTIAIGTPPEEAQSCFTRVLSGMIAMSRLRWPKGVTGRDIEAIGRAPLWYAHQDFDHGLGHGVGAYLSVHEGPQRLSRTSTVPLEPGMILSNEPGYYREGAFGIRIENLLVCVEAEPLPGGDTYRKMLTWRTLTYVPIDRRLIRTELLDAPTRDWLNAYHAEVAKKIGPRVGEAAKAWLRDATAPL